MPLFGFRTDKKYDKPAKVAAVKADTHATKAKKSTAGGATKETRAVAIPKGNFSTGTGVILRPHVTEKSGILSQAGVYTFQVSKDANKNTIAKAVSALYKVTPVKIAVTNLPAKNVFVRGKKGIVAGIRKAVVTVKKGDKIDFV